MTDKIRLNGQWLTWLLVAGAPAVWAQAPANQTVVRDIPGIVKAGTPIVVIKNGLAGADDPIGLPDGSVLFTEPNASRVLKLRKDGTLSTFLENTYGGLGMSLDLSERLIQATSEDGHTGVAVIDPPARRAILAETYNGLPFNRPNDLIADKKGGVYVTDPGLNGDQRAALERRHGANALASRLPPAVYYIPSGGNPIRIAEGIERPNGVTLSRDERILYINNTNGIYLLAFDIQPDGTVRNRRNLAVYQGRSKTSNGIPGIVTGADGLTIDSEGRLYGLTEAGVEVFSSGGKPLGVIPVSCNGGRCQGIAFGGPNKRTLYLAGAGGILKIQLLAKGFAGRAK